MHNTINVMFSLRFDVCFAGDTQPARPVSRQKTPQHRHLSPLKWSSSLEPLEWNVHVERALSSQQLSQSWSEIVREKHIALEAALHEVEKFVLHSYSLYSLQYYFTHSYSRNYQYCQFDLSCVREFDNHDDNVCTQLCLLSCRWTGRGKPLLNLCARRL